MTPFIHNIPGRMRVKLPVLKHNDRASLDIRRKLEGLDNISKVSTRAATGSVLIYYRADKLEAAEIFSYLKKNGYFNGSEPDVELPPCKIPGSPDKFKLVDVIIGFALERILAVAIRPLGCH